MFSLVDQDSRHTGVGSDVALNMSLFFGISLVFFTLFYLSGEGAEYIKHSASTHHALITTVLHIHYNPNNSPIHKFTLGVGEAYKRAAISVKSDLGLIRLLKSVGGDSQVNFHLFWNPNDLSSSLKQCHHSMLFVTSPSSSQEIITAISTMDAEVSFRFMSVDLNYNKVLGT